jgi:hypothetical protein
MSGGTKLSLNPARSCHCGRANLIRQRTREGMAVAGSRGKLRGKQPKLKLAQAREVNCMRDSGDYSIAEIAELFGGSRPTVYRVLQRSLPGDGNTGASSAAAIDLETPDSRRMGGTWVLGQLWELTIRPPPGASSAALPSFFNRSCGFWAHPKPSLYSPAPVW